MRDRNDWAACLEEKFEQERMEEVETLLTQGRSEKIEFTGGIMEKGELVWNIVGLPVNGV